MKDKIILNYFRKCPAVVLILTCGVSAYSILTCGVLAVVIVYHLKTLGKNWN